MIDPEEYIQPRPTAHSHVYIEYVPSPALNTVLREFVRPSMLQQRRFGEFLLRSGSYLLAPIVPGGHALEHPPELANHLLKYQNRLDDIKTHQLRLASFVDMHPLPDESLIFHFEMLPNDLERKRLGRLALKNAMDDSQVIGVAAHIPARAVHPLHQETAAKMRNLFGMMQQLPEDRQHTTPAPLARGLWVKQPMIRDRYPLHVLPNK